VRSEEPLPPVRLEPVGNQEEHAGQPDEQQVGVRERPADVCEVARGEERDADREDSGGDVQEKAASRRPEQLNDLTHDVFIRLKGQRS
jgi:hypothetical protein